MRANTHISTRVPREALEQQALRLLPRKAPKQGRSEATVEVILEAAAHILIERGYMALTTNAAALRAGVSIGSLYQYFPGKEALLAALLMRHANEIDTVLENEFRHAMTESLPVAVRRLVRSNIEIHQLNPLLHKALSRLDARFMPPNWISPVHSVVPKIATLLELHRAVLAVTNLGLAAFLAYQLVESCTHAAVVEKHCTVSTKQLEDELTQALLRYLMINPPAC